MAHAFEHLKLSCPQCGVRMSHGYIPTGGGIFWFDHPHQPGIVPFARALEGTSAWYRRAKLEAYHCPRCHLVTFRYGQTVPDESEM
jgi:ribosomal protein S27AE